MNLEQHFINTFVEEISHLNGTYFEKISKIFLALILKEKVIAKGHNLYAKPVKSTADLNTENYEIVGQCGTDKNYFNAFKTSTLKKFNNTLKPIKDIESAIKNHPQSKVIYLFSNHRAQGSELSNLNNYIKTKNYKREIKIYDSQRIANLILDNIINFNKIEKVLQYLPKTYEYYKILPQTNKLPSFKANYYERKEENEIIEILRSKDVIQIFGVSGIGKTEISKNIANKLINEFDSILWINGENISNKNELSSIQLQRFNNTINLEYVLQEFKVLIVVDNLNEDVKTFVNQFKRYNYKKSKCIMTSLQRDLAKEESFELSFIESDIAKKILCDADKKPTKKQVDIIIENINGYPLVLELIKSSINTGDFDWKTIIREINSLIEFTDEKNQKLSERIIGKFTKILLKEFQWIKLLNNTKLSRHFLLSVTNKISINNLEKRSLISIQDSFSYSIHQLILDSIKIITPDPSNITEFENNILKYLNRNNTIKSVEYFKFLINHRDFIQKVYLQLQYTSDLKKSILYAQIQSTDSFYESNFFLEELSKFSLHPKENYIDLLLFIEKSEIELFKIDKNTNDYEVKSNDYIKKLKSILQYNDKREFKLLLLHHIGKAYFKKKDLKNAKKFFEKILELEPDSYRTRLQLARLLLNEKNISDCIKQIDYVFEKFNPSQQPLTILLSFYELLSHKNFEKQRKKYIDDKEELFISVILNSIDASFEQTYKVIEKLSGHLAYFFKDSFNEICNSLPLPANLENNEGLRFSYAKIKLSQYKMLKYSEEIHENELKQIYEIAEKYFLNYNFKNDYERKQLLDLYIVSGNFDKALEFSKQFENKEDKFYYQNLCKIYKGKENFDLALKYIDKAISKSEEKNYFLAAFYNDKAEVLFKKNDQKAIEYLEKAIELQSTEKTRKIWEDKKETWIEKFKKI